MEVLKPLMNILKTVDQNKKVFLDSNFIIYIIEGSVDFQTQVSEIVDDLEKNKTKLVTSTITIMECLTGLIKTNKDTEPFFEMIKDFNIDIADVSRDIAIKAANVRAKYPGIKQMDSIQLASASYLNCDYFITNDKQLCNQYQELKMIMIRDYKKGDIQ